MRDIARYPTAVRNRLRLVTHARRVFGVATTTVRFDGSVYYVPNYAAHRPVAQKILTRSYVEPALHGLVERVMTDKPGSMVSAGAFFGDMLPRFRGGRPGSYTHSSRSSRTTCSHVKSW